jgi:hypothetical protein
VIESNLKLVRKAWEVKTHKLDVRARLARNEMMTALVQLSKEEIKGRRPKGQKATAGQPPMNRTGHLRASIHGVPFDIGLKSYSAVVGPGLIYGRSLEVAGKYAPPSWRGTTAMAGFPYMRPAYEKFKTSVYPQIVARYLRGIV